MPLLSAYVLGNLRVSQKILQLLMPTNPHLHVVFGLYTESTQFGCIIND